MPNSQKAVCKSVEVELQTADSPSPRAYICFDVAEMANAATCEAQGALLTQRKEKIFSWPKVCSVIGSNPYFMHNKYTVSNVFLGVVCPSRAVIRLKFKGYYKPTIHASGNGLAREFYLPQEN